jgi:predicted DNA-binding protein
MVSRRIICNLLTCAAQLQSSRASEILQGMFSTSFKLNKELAQRVKRCAQAGGYSSVQEFIDHVLEKELSKIEDSDSDEEIARKLKGLGYLD